MQNVAVHGRVARYTVSRSSMIRFGGVPIPLTLVTEKTVELIIVECPTQNVEYRMERVVAQRYGFRSAINPSYWVVPRTHWEVCPMRGNEQGELFLTLTE